VHFVQKEQARPMMWSTTDAEHVAGIVVRELAIQRLGCGHEHVRRSVLLLPPGEKQLILENLLVA
jgi:hypothetical protein